MGLMDWPTEDKKKKKKKPESPAPDFSPRYIKTGITRDMGLGVQNTMSGAGGLNTRNAMSGVNGVRVPNAMAGSKPFSLEPPRTRQPEYPDKMSLKNVIDVARELDKVNLKDRLFSKGPEQEGSKFKGFTPVNQLPIYKAIKDYASSYSRKLAELGSPREVSASEPAPSSPDLVPTGTTGDRFSFNNRPKQQPKPLAAMEQKTSVPQRKTPQLQRPKGLRQIADVPDRSESRLSQIMGPRSPETMQRLFDLHGKYDANGDPSSYGIEAIHGLDRRYVDPTTMQEHGSWQEALRNEGQEVTAASRAAEQSHLREMEKTRLENKGKRNVAGINAKGTVDAAKVRGTTSSKKEDDYYSRAENRLDFVQKGINEAQNRGDIDSTDTKALAGLKQSLEDEWDINVEGRSKAAKMGLKPVTLPDGRLAYTDGKNVYDQKINFMGSAR